MILDPPELHEDPDGRMVPLIHSGAFCQFLGRLDVITRPHHRILPKRSAWYQREIVDYTYNLYPVDSRVKSDAETLDLLSPYIYELALSEDLNKPIAYAKSTLMRRNPNGTDSVVGNIVADAIRTRVGLETDFAVTNSMGIRDNIYQGIITKETLYNVFPFENTITTLFLSGSEVQELFNFIAGKTTSRGCQTQVQVSGVELTIRCDCASSNEGCCKTATRYNGEYPKACAENIKIGGSAINPNGTYELGANDYMAKGGSGFEMLRRNTTQKDSGISLRTAVEEYMQKFDECDDPIQDSCNETDPDSPACQYKRIYERFGAPPCINPVGMIDGRIQRRVAQ